jgi:hypothetical protein
MDRSDEGRRRLSQEGGGRDEIDGEKGLLTNLDLELHGRNRRSGEKSGRRKRLPLKRRATEQ